METSPSRPEPIESSVTKIQLKIGPYEIWPIPTGIFGLDGGAMFGTVPKVLWDKTNPVDSQNRIAMEARALLLKSSDRKILIDAGNGSDFIQKYGEKLGSKFAEIYAVDESGNSLHKSLKAAGVTADEITDVVLTHLHFDHAGGGTCWDGQKVAPTFKNAKYYIQRRNLETAQSPNIREKASYFAINYEPLKDRLVILDGPQKNLFPNIDILVSNGHTQGQQHPLISDEKNKLLYCGDLIPTSTHVRLAWIMGYDLHPLEIIEEKKKFLSTAAQEGWHLFFEHDPYCDTAVAQTKGSDFEVKERFAL